MRCAVIGGGINGVMTAWALARRGHQVDLYERGELMGATSSASTKLIHGGLRYLEHGEFRLVRESLRERRFWMSSAPHLVHKLELILPVYKTSRRPRWILHCGLLLYDLLAGKANIGKHRWLSRNDLLRQCPELNSDGLGGGFAFFDAQMDDHALGLWAAEKAQQSGVNIRTHVAVTTVTESGTLSAHENTMQYEVILNVAGPWSENLLIQSRIPRVHSLDLVRGSHLLLERPAQHAFLVEVPDEDRFCFILPYQERTLLGTTEVRQMLQEPIECSKAEEAYLLQVYNRYVHPQASEHDVLRRFSGLRPLIRSNHRETYAPRDYVIERQGRLLTVFGGKWTTAHALGEKVASQAEASVSPLMESANGIR